MNTMRKCSTCGNLFEGDLCPRCVAGFAQAPTNPTAPPEELPLRIGETFHGMEILELLGRGGMGVVYKARQPSLDRLIALKILPKRLATDPDFQNRFIREAKALASLNHPNIVAVYDFGADGGLFFLAMEFVDGTHLREIIRDKSLKAEQALKIVPQLCDALEFAHAEGVVHRDIKPENILLDKKGRVKIADFGLAKLTGADAQQANLTMTNMVMGTPHYMAPEQVENPKGVDHRADIYAIGVVFYEMLTGELPIGRFEMPSKKVQIDVRLDEVVLKTLEKAPDRRYQKAGEVRDAITRATSVGEAYMPTVMTPKPAPRSKAPFALMAAAMLVLGIALGVAFMPKSPSTPPAAGPAAPLDLSRLHFGPEERPQRYIFATPDKVLPKNPIAAKTPEELRQLNGYLAAVGLANLSPADLRQGYAAVWFRGAAAVVALETPVAERIEQAFLGLKDAWSYAWTHRQGELLVLAWTSDRDERRVFDDLVARVQKKLGLPPALPPLRIDDLKWERTNLPSSSWTMEEAGDFLGRPLPFGLKGSWIASFRPAEEPPGVVVGLFDFKDARDAEAAVEPFRKTPGARRIDVYRVGPLVAVMALLGTGESTPYFKMGATLRDRMGLESWTFDLLLPAAAELPDGYAVDRVQTDAAAVLKDLGLTKARPGDVVRVWRATFKPAGAVLILEIADEDVRSAVESEVRQVGPGWRMSHFVVGIEAPEDDVLDALENLMREKCGWDRNSPRPTKLRQLRLQAADLPKGITMGTSKVEGGVQLIELGSPQGPLKLRLQETNNYGTLRTIVAGLDYAPGDILLVQNFVICHGKGPEAAWDSLEALEAVLRKKMRMPKLATAEDVPDGYKNDEGKFVSIWASQTRERPQIRKLAEPTGVAAPEVAAVGYTRGDETLLLFELRQPPATPPAAKPGWTLIHGRGGRFIAALADPVDPKLAEAVRGILRAKR